MARAEGAGPGRPATARTPAQTFALAFGALYLLVGLVGFLAADAFTGGGEDDRLVIFHVNHLHNIVHLVIGGAWLAASRAHSTAKSVNVAMGAAYLLVALLGFLGLEFMQDLLNIRGSGDPDNFLHLVSGAASLYFGTAGAEGTGARPATV